MIKGSCLCGGVQFELVRAIGPFELCHCNRCRKVSGSAFMAGIGVRREDFRFVRGQEIVRSYDAPILDAPPAYRSTFCSSGTSWSNTRPRGFRSWTRCRNWTEWHCSSCAAANGVDYRGNAARRPCYDAA
jgi:hypothetical protein